MTIHNNFHNNLRLFRLVKAYTRGGDEGETSLLGGARCNKATPRVCAYGDVDELNSFLGLARALVKDAGTRELLHAVQKKLFALGADLANPKPEKFLVTTRDVEWLEKQADAVFEKLPALHSFVIPNGSLGASVLHVARAVCRRAERSAVALAERETVNPEVLRFLNRLSSLLFVLARLENKRSASGEEAWRG